jgi:hypothetical protein
MMNLKFDTESLTFFNVNKKPDKIQSRPLSRETINSTCNLLSQYI